MHDRVYVSDDLAKAIAKLLRLAPDSWADLPEDFSADEKAALNVLTAAEFIWQRRITFTNWIPGEGRTERFTTEMTFEPSLYGAARPALEKRCREPIQEDGKPVGPVVVFERHEWRLTAQGLLAKADLESGKREPIAFALCRAVFGVDPWSDMSGRATGYGGVRVFGVHPSSVMKGFIARPPTLGYHGFVNIGAVLRSKPVEKPDAAAPTAEQRPSSGPSPKEKRPAEHTHSGDFRSVSWFGQSYVFTRSQAAVVKLLWEHWEKGTPIVDGQYLLNEAEIDQSRLSLVFRDHPAWNTMIVREGKSGYRLNPEPPQRAAKPVRAKPARPKTRPKTRSKRAQKRTQP